MHSFWCSLFGATSKKGQHFNSGDEERREKTGREGTGEWWGVNKKKCQQHRNARRNPVIPMGSEDTGPLLRRLSFLLMSKLSSMHSGGLKSHTGERSDRYRKTRG